MSGTRTPAVPERAGTRGRIDKRAAILDAAFTAFAREGYPQATVDTIAAEAGVAKHTVYNHFGDKQTLFRESVAAEADRALVRNMGAVERLRNHDGDIRTALEDVSYRLVQCYCDERSWALRRLLHAELAKFPDLFDIVRGRATDRVLDALADQLARLTLAGRLRATDPVEAAEQLSSLLTGPLEGRCRLGTRQVPDAELRAVVYAAVTTFLAAFG